MDIGRYRYLTGVVQAVDGCLKYWSVGQHLVGVKRGSGLEGHNCILGIATDGNSEVELPAINLRLRRSAFTSPVELLLI